MKSLIVSGFILSHFLVFVIGSFLFDAVAYNCEDAKENFALRVINDLHKELDDNN